MTALERMEAALREHAAGMVKYEALRRAQRMAAAAEWRAFLHERGFAPDGERYATKAARTEQVRANRRTGA